MTVNFVTSNTALDTFEKLQKEERERRLSDARAENFGSETEYNRQSMPSRLRSVEADARSKSSDADVNVATAGNRIAQSGVGLEQAQTNLGSSKVEAGVQAATAPNRVELSGVNLGKAKTEAGSEDVEAGVRRETAPVRVQQAHTGLRQANASALNSELQSRYKALDLLDNGNIEGAQEVARASGYELTPEIINNSDWRNTVKEVHKKAALIYPNRPRDQQTYIDAQIGELRNRGLAGRPPSDPTATSTMPPGAPEPQEVAGSSNRFEMLPGSQDGVPGVWKHDRTTGERVFEPNAGVTSRSGAGAAGGGRTPAVLQVADAMVAARAENPNLPPLTREEAILRAQRAPRDRDDISLRERLAAQATNNAATNAAKTYNRSFDRAAELKKWREYYGLPAQPGAAPVAPAAPGAPAAAPAAQRPDMMTPGNGSQPQNIPLPPLPQGVPPGSSYSPARQMWRSADGQLFDQNGRPVQQ